MEDFNICFYFKILKRFNKKTLSNYFNLIGRKLLGIDDGSGADQAAAAAAGGNIANANTIMEQGKIKNLILLNRLLSNLKLG